MKHLPTIVTSHPRMRVGIGGNVYVFAHSKKEMECFCKIMGFSPTAIYKSKKYNCYAVRIKNEKRKKAVRDMFIRKSGREV